MSRTAVIGSGTWGSALAMLLSHNGHEVTVWSAFQEEIDGFLATRKHPNLPGADFPESILFTSDLEKAMADKEILVLAVPSVFTRGTAAKMAPFYKEGQIIVSVSKGIEEYQKKKDGALLIITHSTKILESLHVDYTHVLVKGNIVHTGDGSLVDEINANGFERFVKED